MKKLLIVVDYQCDFVNGPLGFPEAVALDDIISNKIAELRADGGDIAFTMGSKGPLLEKAANYPGEIPVF